MAKKGSRRTAAIPENETAAGRFIRVVTPRVNKAVKSIDVIGFCAAGSYEYTPQQVKQIIEVLQKEVLGLAEKFAGKKGQVSSFQFKE